MNRLKGLVGAAPPPEGSPRPVIELVTSGRTFVLAAASILMPKPMTTSMAISGEVLHKPLYLFGWPFPVPPMDEQKDEVRAPHASRRERTRRLGVSRRPAWHSCPPRSPPPSPVRPHPSCLPRTP